MTPELRLLSGFARGVSLSLHVRVTCLHSGSWLLSGFFRDENGQPLVLTIFHESWRCSDRLTSSNC